MWQSISERRRWAAVVALVALALAALNVWWVSTYREGYPLDVDEVSYTAIALVDYEELNAGGLDQWREAVLRQAPTAPLLPAVTSIAYVIRAGTPEGFIVLSGFLVLLALAAYGIGGRLAGPRLGALAAIVTVTAPGAFLFSREFVFAMPAAALLALSVYLLLRSDGLRARGWAIACGAALGLMLLARTMTIAFVPGILAAGVLAMVARAEGDIGRRLLNLGLLALTGVAVAATWYAENLDSVLDYLTSYGYGAQSSNFGSGDTVLSWERIRSPFVSVTQEGLLLPLAALCALGLAVLAVALVRRVAGSPDRGAVLRRLAATDALSVAIVVLAGYAALVSSQNSGHGFSYPLAALVPVLAVVALRLFPRAVVPVVAIVAVVAGFNVLSNMSVWAGAARQRAVDVPGFGDLSYANGVPSAVSAIREQVPGPETRFDDHDREWLRVDRALVEQVLRWPGPEGELPVAVFASRHRALTTNSFQYAGLLGHHILFPIAQLAAEPEDSVSTYFEQLAAPTSGPPTVLVTTSTNAGDFEPAVTQRFAEAAARRLGFRLARTMRLPDGRTMRLWRRQKS